MAAVLPEDGQRPGQPQHPIRVTGVRHERQGGTEVGLLRVELPETTVEVSEGPKMIWIPALTESDKVCRVSLSGLDELLGVCELVQPELAQRLQHQVTRLVTWPDLRPQQT